MSLNTFKILALLAALAVPAGAVPFPATGTDGARLLDVAARPLGDGGPLVTPPSPDLAASVEDALASSHLDRRVSVEVSGARELFGRSLDLAVHLTLLAGASGRRPAAGVAATGRVVGGRVLPVNDLPAKVEAAASGGARRLLVPPGQASGEAAERARALGLALVEVETVGDALNEAAGASPAGWLLPAALVPLVIPYLYVLSSSWGGGQRPRTSIRRRTGRQPGRARRSAPTTPAGLRARPRRA